MHTPKRSLRPWIPFCSSLPLMLAVAACDQGPSDGDIADDQTSWDDSSFDDSDLQDDAVAEFDECELDATILDAIGDGEIESTRAVGYIVSVTDSTTTEAGGTGSFSVRLSHAPTSSVTLTFALNDTSEATLSHSSLTFTTSNWSTPRVVTVTGRNDSLVDGSTLYHVAFRDSNSSDSRYDRRVATSLIPAPIAMTNADDEYGLVLINKSSDPAENGFRSTLRVKLSRAPSSNVTLALSSSDTTEATLTTTSLTFTPSNWNTLQFTQVVGVDDEIADGRPAYNVNMSATSADANFQGKTLAVPFTTYDDDWTFIARSPASPNSFTCTNLLNGFIKKLSFTGLANQERQLAQSSNDDSYVEVNVLNVVLRSTYTRTFTDDQISSEIVQHGEAMHKVFDATHGLLHAVRTNVVVEKFWNRDSFVRCEELNPSCPEPGKMQFMNFAGLRSELLALGFDVEQYDVVQVQLPFDAAAVDSEDYWGYAFAIPIATNPMPWWEGRATFYIRRPTETTARSSVSTHELAHQLEWALERGGQTQMLNPDDAFWRTRFPARTSGESPSWPEADDAALRAMYWTQRGDWSAMTTASVRPIGENRTRTGTHRVLASCDSSTQYSERRTTR